jgi:hypothetical protein
MDQVYEVSSLPENYEVKIPVRIGLLSGCQQKHLDDRPFVYGIVLGVTDAAGEST